jgi:hypothetical protein
MCFFESLVREFLTQLAIWFVVFLRLEMFFGLISHLLSLPCSQSSSVLWKWHRRLGHLSFDLLCRLSGFGLL